MTSTTDPDPFTLEYARTHPFQGIPSRALQSDTLQYSIYALSSTLPVANSRLAALTLIRTTALSLLDPTYLYHRCLQPSFPPATPSPPYPHITGHLEYADAIDDEWHGVSLLLSLSRAHPEAWIRATDTSDGEFLLVEAAHVLPRWLDPDTAVHRVWINGGRLYIIPGRRGETLTLPAALDILAAMKDPGALLRDRDIEREAFARVKTAREGQGVHHAVAEIPRVLAGVLRSVPRSVAAATEAFYVRDPIAMRCLKRPERRFGAGDTVRMEVRFTKVLYAQLKGQMWDGGDSVGEKLVAGFEMLVARENEGLWKKSEGVWKIREEVVKVLDEGKALPMDEEVKSWGQRNDSEDWLDIDFTEFEKDLKTGGDGAAPGTYGDAAQEEKMKRMVDRFEKFLNDDEAGMDGVEFEHDDDDDDTTDDDENSEISFDEEEFSKLMRQMMGMPPDRPLDSDMLPPDDGDDEEMEIRKMQDAVGRELKEAGVLGTAKPENPRIMEVNEEEEEEEEEDEPGSDEEVNVDFELVKNMLESFKSQAGLAGPGGNLLASLGIQLPRDEPESATTTEGKGKGKAVEQ